ncbi:uncharacterized protein LOC129581181 isoform X2 [Paramacrobiotus metropolitanus]|nr:uncharacterized protein LOC129581181 isoform X2 [Paramacrobiotus metropolitanus]
MEKLSKREHNNIIIFLHSCGPLVSFALECSKTWFLHRHCCLIRECVWNLTSKSENVTEHPVENMLEPLKGPFIVVRDQVPRGQESPTSYSSSNGNGDTQSEAGQVNNNNNGPSWILSELELAMEANPPFIIVDSLYAEEVAKNIYRGNLCRMMAVTGSVISAGLAFSRPTLPVAVPILSMTLATAGFYGVFYMRDPSLKYLVLGRRWRTSGFQLNSDHFLYSDQPPLILKAANSRFRKALRILPTFLPLLSVGIVVYRFWKVLS